MLRVLTTTPARMTPARVAEVRMRVRVVPRTRRVQVFRWMRGLVVIAAAFQDVTPVAPTGRLVLVVAEVDSLLANRGRLAPVKVPGARRTRGTVETLWATSGPWLRPRRVSARPMPALAPAKEDSFPARRRAGRCQ